MSGLIQRLLDRSGGAVPQAAPVRPAALSGSPLASHDQRLQDPSFRDAGIGMPDFGSPEPSVEQAGPDSIPVSPTRPERSSPLSAKTDGANAITPSQMEPTTWQQIEDPIAALRAAAPIVPTPPIDRPVVQSPSSPEATTARAPSPSVVASPPAPAKSIFPALPGQIAKPPAPIPMPSVDSQTARPVAVPAQESQQMFTPEVSAPSVPIMTPAPLPEAVSGRPTSTVNSQPQLELIRPVAPIRALPEMPRPDAPAPSQPATQEHQREVERIIERVTRQDVAAKADPQPKVRSEKPTAQNVSRIGSLPTRRRSHTIFGSRRG